MRRPPAPGSDGPEQRRLEDKLPGAFAENPTLSAMLEQSPLCSGLFFVCDRKTSHPPTPLLLLFRKKPRSARLYGCKRPHDGAPSLPTFCELREAATRLPQM